MNGNEGAYMAYHDIEQDRLYREREGYPEYDDSDDMTYDHLYDDDGPDTFPQSFDEWNARRMNSGMNPGTFWDYLEAMPQPQRTALDRAALIQFKAIDEDEEI